VSCFATQRESRQGRRIKGQSVAREIARFKSVTLTLNISLTRTVTNIGSKNCRPQVTQSLNRISARASLLAGELSFAGMT
jgi:hypothetical protein